MSDGRNKVTKEVLCEEARFILANIMTAARIGGENRFHDIRRQCETAISVPFAEYISFMEHAGYIRHDRSSEVLEITGPGESIVNGANLSELTERAVAHFKNVRRRKEENKQHGQHASMASPHTPPPRERSFERSLGGIAHDRPLERSVNQPIERASDRGYERMNSDRFNAMPAGGPPPPRPPASMGAEPHSTGELLDSRYEKLATIGTGGIGTVYRARQVPLNREVALKEIRELFGFFAPEQSTEIIRRFTEVVRSAAQLAHPNIVPIHEVNLERDHPYVVTELAPNGSSRRLINDAETIPVELVLKYLLQTLHALQAAHRHRVYHRGLKPENLLIDAYGNVKISDFGFARIVERDAAVIRQVYVGMGNIAYMAPELYHDPVAAGPQTDIYALGIIFYELLTRRLPGRRSPMPSEINSALPRGIDDIFDRMTRDARAERYSSVDDILDDINAIDGLADILDQQTQVLAAQNPLEQLTFREGSEADPLAPSRMETAIEDTSKGKGSAYRPYSYQQRRKR